MFVRQVRPVSRRASAFRGITAAFLIVCYVFSGALHEIFDIDLANPTGSTVIVVAEGKSSQAPERGMVAGHHCHGCFSVSVPAPAQQAALVLEPKVAEFARRTEPVSGTVHGLDPPPPKSLT